MKEYTTREKGYNSQEKPPVKFRLETMTPDFMITEQRFNEFKHLLSQLSSAARAPESISDQEVLDKLFSHPRPYLTVLLFGKATVYNPADLSREPIHSPNLAQDELPILGMGQVVFIDKKVAKIENVVVHELLRGMGAGTQILLDLIEKSRERGVDLLILTSNPTRTTAHRLYESLGFKKKRIINRSDGTTSWLFELDLQNAQ